jgi:hypothetical protein
MSLWPAFWLFFRVLAARCAPDMPAVPDVTRQGYGGRAARSSRLAAPRLAAPRLAGAAG